MERIEVLEVGTPKAQEDLNHLLDLLAAGIADRILADARDRASAASNHKRTAKAALVFEA